MDLLKMIVLIVVMVLGIYIARGYKDGDLKEKGLKSFFTNIWEGTPEAPVVDSVHADSTATEIK